MPSSSAKCSFVYRLAGIEGKDGNPSNEVRVLCNSILLNEAKMQIDKLPGWPMSAGDSLKLPQEKSVLKLKVGDEVKLSETDLCGSPVPSSLNSKDGICN
jgi:hypothetical protein